MLVKNQLLIFAAPKLIFSDFINNKQNEKKLNNFVGPAIAADNPACIEKLFNSVR